MRAWRGGWIAGLCVFVVWAMQGSVAATSVPVPVQTSLLVDQAGVLDSGVRVQLESRLRGFQNAGRAQVAILITGDIGDEPLAAHSLRVAESWRLGRAKSDDGLLILVVPSRNVARIEVGYGIEGDVPDAIASRWVAELLPSIKSREFAPGLNRLLDRIDGALPQGEAARDKIGDKIGELIKGHPEWKAPFVIMIFSVFSLFPLLLGGFMSGFAGGFSSSPARSHGISWSSVFSGVLLAVFTGIATGLLWGAKPPTYIATTIAFTLPLLWGLNFGDDITFPSWLRYAKVLGNGFAVMLLFAIITLAIGTALFLAHDSHYLAAPLFAALMALGVAVFLFPEQARYLMIGLRSYVHFLLMAMVVYGAMQGFNPQPGNIAFAVAGAFAALSALIIYLDGRDLAHASSAGKHMRWSMWLTGLAILMVLPFAIMLLMHGLFGDDFHTRLMHVAAGGGSIAAVLWWAAGIGFFASLRVGLGGLFGGGGAE